MFKRKHAAFLQKVDKIPSLWGHIFAYESSTGLVFGAENYFKQIMKLRLLVTIK